MSVSEAQRLHLFKSFERFPDEDVATLMELLPPSGWGEVATKRDLDARSVAFQEKLDAQSALFRKDLDVMAATLRADFRHETNRYIGWMLASNTALVAAVAAITSAS